MVSTDYISLDFIRYSTSVVLWGKFWENFFMYGLVVVDVKHRIDLYMGPSLKLTVSGFIQLPRLGPPDLQVKGTLNLPNRVLYSVPSAISRTCHSAHCNFKYLQKL